MVQENWLVTGGAGYIGSHIVDQLLSSNRKVIVYDSLSHGLESRIRFLEEKHKIEIPLVVGDIRSLGLVDETLKKFTPVGVIHTAALKSVTDSFAQPEAYFSVNTEATSSLIKYLIINNVKKFIFSSTAAVYGTAGITDPVKESEEKNPISPYGISKLMAENYVTEFLSLPGNSGTSLRFFNVVGTTAPELTDNSKDNLIPILIDKFRKGAMPIIFGTDYPTPDGTCLRDYVDVRDVARAHITVINHPSALPLAMNVGTGSGVSVREIIDLVAFEFGVKNTTAIESDRRSGDPSQLYANVSLIVNEIGFSTDFDIKESINSLFRP